MSDEQPLPANNETEHPTPQDEPFIVDAATDEVLRIHLDQFEGPFEVLLYLIRSQEIDIFDIPILQITEQYLRFLDLMREENLDVTGEFLVMAATLIQIKSKMLLPAGEDTGDDEEIEDEDPRMELVEKLLEYRQFRHATTLLDYLMDERAKVFARGSKPSYDYVPEEEDEYLEVSLHDLMMAFKGVLRYVVDAGPHTVEAEHYSVDDKIDLIQERLSAEGSLDWLELLNACKAKTELVCCFLAILELCRMRRVRAHQHKTFGNIRLFLAEAEHEAA